MLTYKERLCKKTALLTLVSAIFLFLFFPQTIFGLALYDDFSDFLLDATKWQNDEFVRVVQDGQLRLKVRSSANSGEPVEANLQFRNPDAISAIEAKVTPVVFSNSQGAQSTIRVGGRFFNDGTTGGAKGLYTGDILAYVGIGGGQGIALHWYVARFIHPTDPNQPLELVAHGDFDMSPVLGTQYAVSVAWDGSTFTFRVSDGNISEEAVSAPGLPVHSASMPAKFLATRISSNAGLEAALEAFFDDVRVNGSLDIYDDFSMSALDTAKWNTSEGYYEIVRNIDDEALQLKIRTSTADASGTKIAGLNFSNPLAANIIQAQFSPLAYSNSDGLNVRAGIFGEYYNDGTLNGWEGEVSAAVAIGGTDATPVASWSVSRHKDPVDSIQEETLASGRFSVPIVLGTTYTLSISWNGTKFVFKVNNEEATYIPVSNIYPANYPGRALQTRIFSPGGKESIIEATYDDVMTARVAYQGSIGTQIRIPDDGFGAKKGKVTVGGRSCKVSEWGNQIITCEIKASLPLATHDVVVKPREPKGVEPTTYTQAFTMMAPSIAYVDPIDGSEGDMIMLSGKFFGSKKGKVYLGGKKCKLLTWDMDKDTGASTIFFFVPNKLASMTYDVKVSNKVGSHTLVKGFTIGTQ